jgi:hypothetical protein
MAKKASKAGKASKASKASKPSKKAIARGSVALLIGTRKGGFVLRSDRSRRRWTLSAPMMFGQQVHHMVLDPRDGKTLLAGARTGHLGPTVFRSKNLGKTWEEAKQPPAFKKAAEGEKPLVVGHTFWLTPGHASEPGVWYAGTSPQGLFRSEDAGVTWESVRGFNDHPMRSVWTGSGQDGTPDGPKMHSVIIDPRDPTHMYIGMSGGGVFESADRGDNWSPLNAGSTVDFLPDPNPEFGQDPHCMRMHPLAPDVLYQQNHCGIYRMHRPEGRWVRIGKNMPKKVGDVGFPMVLHPRDPDTCWVFPMDGTAVWPRTAVDGKPAVYETRDAGKKWKRLANGLPQRDAWLTVFRQAMTADAHDPVGLYFGTTTGAIWGSRDQGKRWTRIADNLPHVYAVEAVELPS